FFGELRAGWLADPATATRIEAAWLARYRSLEPGPSQWQHVLRVGLVCHFRERRPEQEARYALR
ncbi:MAG: hypothetical protein ACK4L7_11470, partial [Flavobacteriales bacterium]